MAKVGHAGAFQLLCRCLVTNGNSALSSDQVYRHVAPYATAEEPTTPDDRGAHEPFGRPLVSTYSYFAPVPRTATARHDLR